MLGLLRLWFIGWAYNANIGYTCPYKDFLGGFEWCCCLCNRAAGGRVWVQACSKPEFICPAETRVPATSKRWVGAERTDFFYKKVSQMARNSTPRPSKLLFAIEKSMVGWMDGVLIVTCVAMAGCGEVVCVVHMRQCINWPCPLTYIVLFYMFKLLYFHFLTLSLLTLYIYVYMTDCVDTVHTHVFTHYFEGPGAPYINIHAYHSIRGGLARRSTDPGSVGRRVSRSVQQGKDKFEAGSSKEKIYIGL